MEQITNSLTMSIVRQLKPQGDPVKCPRCGIEWFKLTDKGICMDCLMAESRGAAGEQSKQENLQREIKKYINSFDFKLPTFPDYEIKDTPQDKLLHFIKHLHGMPLNSRRWNDQNYARAIKSCKEIIKHFESDECKIKLDLYRMAIMACNDIVNELQTNQMSWTTETIIKRLMDWENQVFRYGKYIRHQYGQNT